MQQKTDPDTRFNLAPSASLTRVLPMPLVNQTFSFHNHLPVGGAFTRSLDVFAMCSALNDALNDALGVLSNPSSEWPTKCGHRPVPTVFRDSLHVISACYSRNAVFVWTALFWHLSGFVTLR